MNTEDKENIFMHKWDKIKRKPKLNYIIRKGILYYGLFSYSLCFLTFSLSRDYFRSNKIGTFVNQYFSSKNSIMYYIIFGILFGVFAGIWDWNQNEKRYNNIRIKTIRDKK